MIVFIIKVQFAEIAIIFASQGSDPLPYGQPF